MTAKADVLWPSGNRLGESETDGGKQEGEVTKKQLKNTAEEKIDGSTMKRKEAEAD